MATFDSTLSVYNSAYTKLITLSSALLVTPELAINITPETAIIKENRTDNYEVLEGNEFNYIFAYNQTLDNWNANLSENQFIISHDIISADYGIQITDPENGQPYTVGYYLNNPELQDIRPLRDPTGLPFGEYISAINEAIRIIVDDCGVDMNLIDDNQEVFYQSIYPFPNVVTGVVTNKTSMISVMKYKVGDIKYVLYWGTGININIPTTPVTPEAVLSVYNSAYTKLITLSSALLMTPELAINITPETAVIKQNRTDNYEVLEGNAYNYIFAYNQTLDNWNANLSENQFIISHDIISADYGIQITDPENGQPYTVDYYLNTPELQDIRPLQAPVTGLPFGEYIRAINDAIKIIVDDCGVDMNLIDDNQEAFYQSIYPFPNVVTGVVTNKTSMISVMKYSVGDIKYVFYWGTGINYNIQTSPVISESSLAVYNSAYTKLNTLASALVITPELAVGITPNTAVIAQNRTDNYDVLEGNDYNYIFAYNQTLDNWNANLSENQFIISHDIISADYGITITDPENGQPYTVDYYLNNPELQDIRPLRDPTGLPFGEYIREINDAIKIIVDDCGVDMNLIDDNQEAFYQSIYPFPNVVTGVVTNKTAMINIMKYSVGDIKYVLYWGTGIQSTNIPPTSALYSAVSTAQSILTFSINPKPAAYTASASASASASFSYNGVDDDLNASTEATNLANSISTEEAEKNVLNYVTSSVSPNITIIQFQNSTECTTTPI